MVTVRTETGSMHYGSGALGAGVTLVAKTSNNEHAIFAADVGDALLGDGSVGFPNVAAGRRVSFFMNNDTFEFLTPDGILLFDAATDWTAVPEPSSIALLGLGGLAMLVRRRR